MLKEAVYHIAHGNYAYPVRPDTLRVMLRAGRGDLERVTVIYQDRYQGSEQMLIDMEVTAQDEMFDYYHADLQLETKRFAYVFLLDDGVRRVFYTEKGFFDDIRPNTHFQYPYIAVQDLWEPPAWAQGAVVYQIFPERFANGDPTNDPPNVEPWDTLPTVTSQKGGDLQGIIDRFDHLLELGIDAIYLTPIFEAPSNHKYDTVDYYRIDPHFGDLEKCRELVELCHKHNIKVIFDAVFNHSGYGFFAFQDVLKHGEESPYAHWFNIESFPVEIDPPNYETFANDIYTMPKLMTNEANIDGWRLDVANEIDHDFWREFRKVVKKENPEALIVGEIWHEASEWVRGDQFDCVMNYSVQYACIDFFAKGVIRAETFAHRLAKVQVNHSQSVNRAMFNLLGSHDTERFLTMCNEETERFALAVAFQMTYEGAPMIYYGDEVGMVGKTDPDCRRGMIWDEEQQDRKILQWYKRLIELRKKNPVLRTGDCRMVYADSALNVFGFVRFSKQDQVLVVINNSAYTCHIDLETISWPRAVPKEMEDLLSDEKVKVKELLVLEPFGVRVLG